MSELLRFRGLCKQCYSSGVELVLNEETFEAACDKCRSSNNV